MKSTKSLRWAKVVGMLTIAALVAAQLASGHAILKESSPEANGTVAGPNVPITLKFNGRSVECRKAARWREAAASKCSWRLASNAMNIDQTDRI